MAVAINAACISAVGAKMRAILNNKCRISHNGQIENYLKESERNCKLNAAKKIMQHEIKVHKFCNETVKDCVK